MKIKYITIGLMAIGFLVASPFAYADWSDVTTCGRDVGGVSRCFDVVPAYQQYGNGGYAYQTGNSQPTQGACAVNSFYASQNPVSANSATTLTWNTNNCTNIAISSVGAVPPYGSQVVYPSVTTMYTLYASGAVGSDNRSIQVVVSAPSNQGVTTQGSGPVNTTGSTTPAPARVIHQSTITHTNTVRNITQNTTQTLPASTQVQPAMDMNTNSLGAAAFFGSTFFTHEYCFWLLLILIILVIILIARTFYLRGHRNGYYYHLNNPAGTVVHSAEDSNHIH